MERERPRWMDRGGKRRRGEERGGEIERKVMHGHKEGGCACEVGEKA